MSSDDEDYSDSIDDQASTASNYSTAQGNLDGQGTSFGSRVRRPNIQIFKGNGKDILTIENWFNLVDLLGGKYGWNNNDKFNLVIEYLADEALNFYFDIYKSCDWNDLKMKMIKRFGVKTADPIMLFVDMKYDPKKGVDCYFNEKRRLAGLAGFTEKQTVRMMIAGLDEKLKMCFIANKSETYEEFYCIAKTAESNLSKNIAKPDYRSKQPFIKSNFRANENKNSKKMPGSCFKCERNGLAGQKHWSWNCPLDKDKHNVNSIDITDQKDEEENNLN